VGSCTSPRSSGTASGRVVRRVASAPGERAARSSRLHLAPLRARSRLNEHHRDGARMEPCAHGRSSNPDPSTRDRSGSLISSRPNPARARFAYRCRSAESAGRTFTSPRRSQCASPHVVPGHQVVGTVGKLGSGASRFAVVTAWASPGWRRRAGGVASVEAGARICVRTRHSPLGPRRWLRRGCGGRRAIRLRAARCAQ